MYLCLKKMENENQAFPQEIFYFPEFVNASKRQKYIYFLYN